MLPSWGDATTAPREPTPRANARARSDARGRADARSIRRGGNRMGRKSKRRTHSEGYWTPMSRRNRRVALLDGSSDLVNLPLGRTRTACRNCGRVHGMPQLREACRNCGRIHDYSCGSMPQLRFRSMAHHCNTMEGELSRVRYSQFFGDAPAAENRRQTLEDHDGR